MTAAERREQLLDVTKQLVGEKGLHAVSIESIARGAGITRPIVYGHFEDLGGVLVALLERETARALNQLVALMPAEEAPDPRGRMLTAQRAFLEAVAGDPVTWRLVLMPQEGAPRLLHDRIQEGRALIRETLATLVRPALDSPDPDLTAFMLQALAEEAARLLLTQPEAFTTDRLMAQADWLIGRLAR
jgi:AcrR family transcriptional regulator